MKPEETEKELIEAVQRKDQKAFYRLYDKYSGALYGVIIRMCQDSGLAEELLQESFLKIWNKAENYSPDKGRFYTWAYRIARNTTLNAMRKTSPLIQSEDLSVYKNKEEEEESWDFQSLNGQIQELEPHHRQALSLVYFQGYTHREAHEEMGVPLGTFKSYIRQALKQLREGYQLTCAALLILLGL